MGHAGINHLCHGIVPEILLIDGAGLSLNWISQYPIARMAASDTGGFHAARGRQIGRTQRNSMHARGGGTNGFNIVDAFGGFKDGVDQDWFVDAVFGFQLGQQLVKIMDVPRTFDLGQHDHIELVANR